MSRGQQRRGRVEEEAAKRLEEELEKLNKARDAARHAEAEAEAELREQLGARGIDLVQAQTRAEALVTRVESLVAGLADEKASHEKTRQMLAEALVPSSLFTRSYSPNSGTSLFCATSTPAPAGGHASSHAVSLDLSRTRPFWLKW